MARLYAFFQPLQHLLWSDFYLNRTRQLQFMDNMKFKSITKDTISLFAIWPHGFLEVHWQQMCSTRLLNRLHLTLWRNFTPIPLKHISSVASNWSAKLFNCLDNTGMLVTPEATFDLMRLHAYQMTFTHTHTPVVLHPGSPVSHVFSEHVHSHHSQQAPAQNDITCNKMPS